MVFYFTCSDPRYIIYMGRDKYENEELIRYGWPEDLWFHVDKMSSAHVYLRLPSDETIADVPRDIVIECAQLCKLNSIEGCKQNNVTVVYTMWSNLRKSGDMAVGQVGFHKRGEVLHVVIEKRINEIVNRLNKTKEEKHNHPQELADLRAARDARELADVKAAAKAAKREAAMAEEAERARASSTMETVYGMEIVDEEAMEAERLKLEALLIEGMSSSSKQSNRRSTADVELDMLGDSAPRRAELTARRGRTDGTAGPSLALRAQPWLADPGGGVADPRACPARFESLAERAPCASQCSATSQSRARRRRRRCHRCRRHPPPKASPATAAGPSALRSWQRRRSCSDRWSRRRRRRWKLSSRSHTSGRRRFALQPHLRLCTAVPIAAVPIATIAPLPQVPMATCAERRAEWGVARARATCGAGDPEEGGGGGEAGGGEGGEGAEEERGMGGAAGELGWPGPG